MPRDALFAEYVAALCASQGKPVSNTTLRAMLADENHPTRTWLEGRVGRFIPRKHARIPKVAIIHTVFSRTGGTETWARHFYRLLKDRVPIVGLGHLDGDGQDDGGLTVYRGIAQIRRLAATCDVCICWGLEKEFIDAIRAAKKKDCAIVHMHHGDQKSEWSRRIILDSYRPDEDRIVAVNPTVADELQCKHITNAVDASRVAIGRSLDKSPVVLWLHRFSDEKQPMLSAQACKLCPSHWRFIFAGNRTAVREDVETFTAGDSRFEFLDHAVAKDQFPKANLFLSLSDTDGFGYSMAEAVSSGLRLVATPVGIASDPNLAHQVPLESKNPWVVAWHLRQAATEQKQAIAAQKQAANLFSETQFASAWESLLRQVSSEVVA